MIYLLVHEALLLSQVVQVFQRYLDQYSQQCCDHYTFQAQCRI